jgi:hypothetical protein
MSAMQRITGADWSAWLLLLGNACARGASLGVKASGLVSMAATATTDKWAPATIDLQTLGYTALIGFIAGLVDFIIEKGLPTGNEVTETTETTTTTDKTP